jgi:hypothetical protein
MSPREYHFRDAELRSFPLKALNRVGRALGSVGLKRPSLTPESILAAAHKQAGCDDLGGDSVLEPLERYLTAVREEAELTTFGRLAVKGMLTSSIGNRIELARWGREHPEIRDQKIESPWVIVGLPRTGTSLLSILLALDPGTRALMHWEAARLIPPPTLATAGEDPRIAEYAKELRQLLDLNPAIGAMHPFGATIAQECVALFMYDVRTLGVETQAYVPSYGQWLQTCDMTPAYAQHRLALQALQAAQPTQRWVLKTPNHLWCLPTLHETYPDARIIWTHRDPAKVVTSLASLANALQRMFTDRRDPVPTAEEWRGKARFAIEEGMRFDDENGDAPWCDHVRFEDLMRDPIATVRAIYARYDETPCSLHIRRMEVWLDERGRDSEGKHLYDPQDFGWSDAEINEEFADYRGRYGV